MFIFPLFLKCLHYFSFILKLSKANQRKQLSRTKKTIDSVSKMLHCVGLSKHSVKKKKNLPCSPWPISISARILLLQQQPEVHKGKEILVKCQKRSDQKQLVHPDKCLPLYLGLFWYLYVQNVKVCWIFRCGHFYQLTQVDNYPFK